MTKQAKLIDALMKGKLLERNEGYGILYFFYEEKYKYFEKKGWGSAIILSSSILEDITIRPDNWAVSKYNVKQYPWSIDFKRDEEIII
jgi:hypothetical protein